MQWVNFPNWSGNRITTILHKYQFVPEAVAGFAFLNPPVHTQYFPVLAYSSAQQTVMKLLIYEVPGLHRNNFLKKIAF